MPIISKINLYQYPAQNVISVRSTITFQDYPVVAGKAYTDILVYLESRNLLPAGGPFVCYHNSDLQKLDVELGFPVALPDNGNDNIKGHSIPAQMAVSGIFMGPYEETDCLMSEIMQWITKHGYKSQGQIYHHYLNDDNRSKNELLTRIIIPVE